MVVGVSFKSLLAAAGLLQGKQQKEGRVHTCC